ncbi:Transcription repressor OFP12 [Hibiscus syriacus]|uniref:Transcription repressor n=1 Tax=Hibiscus syriacus TaxID=106335 RepID=A0A6A3A2M9_HIBSY|nr:transcription repressor OFP12-like [Hibiscus syriacus]KAE8698293.1 Transcription repressor OFP12 [Hibiscus syriacus]
MSNMFSKFFPLCFTNLKSMDKSVDAFKNFNQSCQLSSSSSSSTSDKSLSTPSTRTVATIEYSDSDSAPDFATVFASQRFFFSSPGRSNAIVESPDTRPEPETKTPAASVAMDGGVAVKKYSPDPCKDFRVSMLEMIEARNLTDVNKEWEFLHELLLCYLTLNPENTHKFIFSAFADIVVCLLSSPESDAPGNHGR